MNELNWPPNPPSPCPANNFGAGVNADISDEQRIFFLQKWDEWESAHPDDPMGDTYIEQYNARAKEVCHVTKAPEPEIFVNAPVTQPKPIEPRPIEVRAPGRPRVSFAPTMQTRFIIREDQHMALKQEADLTNTSMSEILRKLIDDHFGIVEK